MVSISHPSAASGAPRSRAATALTVGRRHGKPVVLRVDVAGALAQGLPFFRADNGVWLTTQMPAALLSVVEDAI